MKDTTLCDNGVIMIGTCFAIPNLKAIKTFMADDIPLVVIIHSVVMLKHPELLKIAHIRMKIVKNSTQEFCVKGMQLKVLSLAPIESNFSGLFCDHQRFIETTVNSKGCGCYSMEMRRANIITTHNIKFAYKDGKYIFSAEDFTRLNFSSLFQYAGFSISTQFHHLDETNQSDDLFDLITNIFNHVNLNGGFTATRW